MQGYLWYLETCSVTHKFAEIKLLDEDWYRRIEGIIFAVKHKAERCTRVFKENGRWRILDISDKAVEEAAASILSAYQRGRKPS
ncbi:MAG: hypothetical protein JRF69_05610 [Deltaproteobacteria bacterium]|nr:hypothetical protein [Deltaproteobacteria bacterium]